MANNALLPWVRTFCLFQNNVDPLVVCFNVGGEVPSKSPFRYRREYLCCASLHEIRTRAEFPKPYPFSNFSHVNIFIIVITLLLGSSRSGEDHKCEMSCSGALGSREQTLRPLTQRFRWQVCTDERHLWCYYRGITVVRERIKEFAQTKAPSSTDAKKIVILDEADRYVKCLTSFRNARSVWRQQRNSLWEESSRIIQIRRDLHLRVMTSRRSSSRSRVVVQFCNSVDCQMKISVADSSMSLNQKKCVFCFNWKTPWV